MPKLQHLDDTPIYAEDRRRAEAYFRGGNEEERQELDWIKKEKREVHINNHNDFKAEIQRIRDEKEAKTGIKHHANNAVFDKNNVAIPESSTEDKKESMKELMKKAKMEEKKKK